ncbi:fungal-specific transcription factor domain-containing protein [Truncatella angustata]|uniref:Fungal-specific transcription factor domain-containing protein n=1 Tax=Truncatella angustata TaxID=152316 RepID=A0A9P8UQL4_9PEZI|nr:fungal-specific transcription factor domain-containing protein [Truncatella angustata]KAH6656516.1 fungal-specific transcription factor domain-containing protein [Truncatella angustata]
MHAMEATSPRSPPKKASKRSSNACTRCRKQKIKCSGLQPCEGCKKRKANCIFDDAGDKVVVTRAFLLELQRKASRSQQQSQAVEASVSALSTSGHEDNSTLEDEHDGNVAQNNDDEQISSSREGSNQPALTNLLAASPSTFMAAPNGQPYYMGTSSNWSFSGRVLQITHEHVHQTPLPSSALLFDGLAYDLGWGGPMDPTDLNTLAIPSPDYSIYLVNAVKFHCGQMYHLFDDEEFHQNLQQFYSEPENPARQSSLWYIHFLLILAFGKIFIMQKSTGKRPSGTEFFVKAMQILPPAYCFPSDPVGSTEILCCIALYLQCVDHRNAAHIYIGQAMRTAMAYGMHTEMPADQLGEKHVQRCRKVWWTIFVLDRQMTSLMGLPHPIQDAEIQCRLPVYHESHQRTTTLDMHIKLARVIAEINNDVYGANGRLKGTFLRSTKASLRKLAGLAAELGQTLPLRLDQTGHGVSRMSASLHLLYHQCIVLATRPLMFCYLKMKFEAATFSKTSTQDKFSTILQMCIESSQSIIIILESLQSQGLLETFLSLDLDSLHVSSIILVIGSVIDGQLIKDRLAWVQRSLSLLDCMITAGNLTAGWRKTEMLKLNQMLSEPGDGGPSIPYPSAVSCTSASFQSIFTETVVPLGQDAMPLPPLSMNSLCNGDDLSADQILAIASSIQEEDVEWMDRAIAENSIW